MTMPVKPIGRKAYGSIAHLPMSRMGPGDHHCHAGQAVICTEKARDRHDRIIVQEKLDGSCVAVALRDGVLHPIGRAGWPAISSPHEMHHLFAQWVWANEDRFRAVLREGERVCGEWLAQAHGTIYNLAAHEPFAAFDIMEGDTRMPFDAFRARVRGMLATPTLLHDGGPLPVLDAMRLHDAARWPCDETEGVVYRVERRGVVDFLAKYVRPDKVDGKYLKGEPIWLWRPKPAA
ncbi:MAG TPA: RNA ligase family protein [Gemmatimonadales bacterium]|nr:RNA ligase family protein [Gemmatimonadales bacterium]